MPREDGKAYRPAAPLHVVWLATQACRLSCVHCSSNAGGPGRNELSTLEAARLIDDLADAGVVDFAISGGEPLLRRDVVDLVRHAKDRGLAVGLGSSGLGLRRHLARLAATGLDRLQVSVDGTREQHDTLRRYPGLHALALSTIRDAIAAGLRVTMCCTINARNHDSLEHVISAALECGVERVNFSRFVPTGRGTAALDLSADEWRAAIERCHTLQNAYAGRVQIVTHLAQMILLEPALGTVPGFAGCQAGRGQACIAADGSVWPCVMLPIAVGNVRQRSFADIWRSAELIRALADRSRLEGGCRTCGVTEKCGGCRGVAFARTGNPFAADPRCWLLSECEPRMHSASGVFVQPGGSTWSREPQ
jgi:radical SAM protein with 4Fe4S-binding SPASM domain